MNKETLELITDLHLHNERQGPGSDETFSRALTLSGIDRKAKLEIADIGCGTGSASIALAKATNASITAVDIIPEFLEKLEERATEEGVIESIKTVNADMFELPFEKNQFDVIWSEGAIYNIGFSKGIKTWKKFLKPDGVLVVSEITWLTSDIPEGLQKYWKSEYPEIASASAKFKQLEENDYTPIGYFVLSPDCWLENYYEPLKAGFADFFERNKNNKLTKKIIEAHEKEIALYEKYQNHFSYGCYIARKRVV
ncbi:methyltransferase domain-containing protein [Candidatus Woesebacteria bacterium]|nr:methyltransferase domain-containing protein [Candidatus Woesebacteria bacterium]